jgi:hypothetical protein
VKEPLPATITRRLRARYMLAGAMMMTIWGASLVALLHDGRAFNIFAAVFATFTFLPLGLIALQGGLSGSSAGMQRARNALFASGGLLALIVVAEVFRRMVLGGS